MSASLYLCLSVLCPCKKYKFSAPSSTNSPAPLESDYPVILWGQHCWLTGKLSVKKVQTRNKKHLHSKRTPPHSPTIILDTPVFSSEKEFKDCARSASLEKRSQKEPSFFDMAIYDWPRHPLGLPFDTMPQQRKSFL